MRQILTIALCAMLLSGCIAEWKNPNGPQRWSGSPMSPIGNNGADTGMGQGNHAMGPGPLNF